MGLDTVELVYEIESAFGIQIEDSVAAKIYTVQDMHNVVFELVQAKGNPENLSRQEQELRTLGIISDKAGLDMHEIMPWKSFTNDLGMD
jgi:acyl carrier protein